MNCNEAANLLRSEDTPKQLHALNEIIPLIKLKKIDPNDEFLNALIERGLSCEKSSLTKIIRWSEVRAAVITEMGTAENAASLYAAIKVLYQLSISDLILFIGSKDGMSVMKSCLFSAVVDIGAVSVETLGPLLLNSWLYVQSINPVDGYMNVETTSEARRFRDDISDFVLEIMKNFAEGLKGKAPGLEAGQYLPDHSTTTCAYFSVIGDLFERYCEKYDKLREWTACVLGKGLMNPQPEFDTDLLSRSASLSLLIRHVLPIILPDPYLLLIRAKELPFHLASMKCVSNIILALLHSLPAQCGPNPARYYHLVFEDKPSMQFGTPEEVDETSISRSKPLNISVIELAEEWVEKVLSSYLLSPVCQEVKEVIYSCLSLTANPHLSHLRPKICSLIVENSFRILSSPSFIVPSSSPKGRVDLSTHIHPTDDQFYEEIISWTIFACRNVPRGFLGEYLPFILSFICKFITDGISRAKLISECTILLLINVDGNGSVAHPEVLFQTLGHPVISTLFLIDSGTSTDVSSGHCFRERFITALCRAIIKMLPITVAYALSTDGTLRNNTIKPDDSFGDSVVNLTPSKVDHHHHATGGDRKPFAGIGCFAELFGTTLRSSGHTTNELNSFSVSADLALQQIDNLVACALFVLRSSHKCILWPIVGLAGESAQLAYIDLISNLVKLVILNPSLASHPPLVQQSLSWAKDSLVDTLSALLTLISGQEKIPSGNAKYQLLILFCQHLQLLFVDYEDRYKSILNLLRNIVLRTEEREMYEKLLTSRSELGYVGGWISSRPCHSFLSIPAQYHAFTILELFVYYNSKINNLPESVLGVLYECEALLEAESKRQHHIISPLIDQRLLLAIRRVKFYCKSDKIETIMTKSNNIQTPNSKGGFNSTDGTPKKMITSRRVSAAFTTFDNSMSDAFLTPEINRKRVDITSGLTPGHINPGCDVVDTMFRIQIAPEYSLPIDVEKVFSIFSSYANSLDNNLVTNSSKSSDAYVCTSDLLGLIDDVLDSYLIVYSPLFQKLPSLVSNDHYRRSKLMSETYDLRDTKEWKQINGSSDMFTVLCSIISYDSYNQDVRFAVRIMNSSGFKVPLFSVQLLLSSIDHYETTTTTATTTTTTATTLKASFDSNKTSSILEGVEYFHLDGLIERIFTIHFHEFSNIFLHIRLIYRELLAESDSIEMFSIPIISTMNQIDENSTTTNTTTEQKKRFKETDLCRTAKLECIPFQFPVFNFLYPYGGSSLSSMTNYRLNLLSNSSIISFLGGIPKNIYQSLHNRLKRSVRLPVIGYCSKNTSTSTTNSIPVIPNFNDEITLEYYNQYYNSKDNYSYQRNINTLINSRVRLGNGNHSSIREFSTSLAWCFQTWWGYEVCITIQLSKLYQSSLSNPFNTQQGGSNMTGATSTSTTSSTSGPESEKYYLYWSGWMEIQCDDISTLNALKYDSLTLLQFLTNNLLQVTSPTSLTASTILSSKSFVHENENKTNNFTTNSLSQSNGLFPLINPSNTVPPPSLPPPLSSSQTTSASKNLFQPAAGTTSKNHEDKKNLLKSKIRNFIHQKFLSENKTFHESSLGGGSGNGGLSLL